MTPRIGQWDNDIQNAQSKINIIRQTLSEIFDVPLECVIEKESDPEYQNTGYGDYVIML